MDPFVRHTPASNPATDADGLTSPTTPLPPPGATTNIDLERSIYGLRAITDRHPSFVHTFVLISLPPLTRGKRKTSGDHAHYCRLLILRLHVRITTGAGPPIRIRRGGYFCAEFRVLRMSTARVMELMEVLEVSGWCVYVGFVLLTVCTYFSR